MATLNWTWGDLFQAVWFRAALALLLAGLGVYSFGGRTRGALRGHPVGARAGLGFDSVAPPEVGRKPAPREPATDCRANTGPARETLQRIVVICFRTRGPRFAEAVTSLDFGGRGEPVCGRGSRGGHADALPSLAGRGTFRKRICWPTKSQEKGETLGLTILDSVAWFRAHDSSDHDVGAWQRK